jgi:hypothetical protein
MAGCEFASQDTILCGINNYTVIVDTIKILISIGIAGVLSKIIVRIRGRLNKNFFGKYVEEFSFNEFGGGILYHWQWSNLDKTSELENILKQKGYKSNDMINKSGGNIIKWKGTRVEMNTVSNPKYYSLEYFSGDGNMTIKKFCKIKKSA